MTVGQFAHSIFFVFVVTVPLQAADDSEVRRIDFNRQIRPILSDTCFTCHGPDEQQRVTELRLDRRTSVFAEHEGHRAVVPGDLAGSSLHQRITSSDPETRMPPPDSGRQLTEPQIELLTEWIRQGAEWKDHWAFVAPERPDLPETESKNWCRNAIDNFVLERLETEDLKPSDEAARNTLIRRVTLDLTGLPPSPEEVRAFVSDSSPDAYEKVVDRLLASPRYGEHMAISWLDAARYADTSGYQNDGPRDMWRWRDWVINAFNSNQPFDQFTIEQLAGDLLENPTLDQRIATGFNRNHRGNAEGGIIAEEYQVEYVVDRVDTTFTVWMGLTMGCARCHDHKYDPIRQKDFYQVYAYFNNIPESGRAIKVGNAPPFIKAPRPEEQQQLATLESSIRAAEDQWESLQADLASGQLNWESEVSLTAPIDCSVSAELVNYFSFDETLKDSVRNAEAASEGTLPGFVAGRKGKAAEFDGTTLVNAGDTAGFGYFDKLSIAAWVLATADNGTIVSRMTPVDQGAGYYVHLQDGRLQVNLINRWLDDAIRVESHNPFPLHEWHHLTVTYDGSRLAEGIHVFLDGQPFAMNVTLDRINQTFALPLEPLRIGGGQRTFTGALDEVRVYARDLDAAEVQLLSVPESVSEILHLGPERRTKAQQLKLTRYYIDQHASPAIREADQKLAKLRCERRELLESLPTVMVMQEMPTPRETYVLTRGQYNLPGDRVDRGVPSVFPPLPANAPNNRLGLARWLVSPDHPLTARVAVNRFWQRFFGQGLVTTTEDFGAQGESPSHPRLLDWLATEFVSSNWNVKSLQKLIVMSATYRQSSGVSPELLLRDPDNRLLARGPRKRLSAETIRDQALAFSGLLTDRIGGPSVKPYQPEGLWQEIATDTEYVQSHSDDLYRRSLYTYWKRTVAPPTMMTLDAPSREVCTVQRSRTNTPLQALALMNDVTFVEAARVFAQQLMTTDASDDRLRLAFVTATSRDPTAGELAILQRRFESSLEAFRNDLPAARKLIHVGELPAPENSDPAELAALTTVTSLILNLDEVVNGE